MQGAGLRATSTAMIRSLGTCAPGQLRLWLLSTTGWLLKTGFPPGLKSAASALKANAGDAEDDVGDGIDPPGFRNLRFNSQSAKPRSEKVGNFMAELHSGISL